MIIKHNREKLLNLITYFVQKTKHCGKTKLFKLLFFADFRAFKEIGISITGLDYYTWPKGPAPIDLHNEFKAPSDDFQKTFSVAKLDNSDRLNIKPKQGIKFNDKYFNKKELEIIDVLACVYRDATAAQMVEVTHLRNSPWDKTRKEKGMNRKIEYKLALDSDKESLTIVEQDEIRKENEAMDSILSLCAKAK